MSGHGPSIPWLFDRFSGGRLAQMDRHKPSPPDGHENWLMRRTIAERHSVSERRMRKLLATRAFGEPIRGSRDSLWYDPNVVKQAVETGGSDDDGDDIDLGTHEEANSALEHDGEIEDGEIRGCWQEAIDLRIDPVTPLAVKLGGDRHRARSALTDWVKIYRVEAVDDLISLRTGLMQAALAGNMLPTEQALSILLGIRPDASKKLIAVWLASPSGASAEP